MVYEVYTMSKSYLGRTYLFSVLTVAPVLCVNISRQQMVFLKQVLHAIDLYLPFKTCDVSQFAFAAFSGVAAGHKVNSPWGRVHVMRNKHNHEVLMSHFDISHLLTPVSLGADNVFYISSKCAVRYQLAAVF